MVNPELLSNFHFLRPAWLLLIIPFAVVIYINWRRVENKQAWQNLIPTHLLNALLVGDKGWTKQLPLKLISVICLVLIIILAGPSYYKESAPFEDDKSSLVLVLNVSESMSQADLAPSRLTFAKQKISDFLDLRKEGRTALIVYAGSAHIAMPLTLDKSVFQPLLDAISGEVMPRNGKRAEYTVPLINGVLSSAATAASVLMITDGVSDKAVTAYARYFAQSEHQLIILAMGNPEANTDEPLDLDSLTLLADDSGGKLVQATFDNEDLTQIEQRIEQHLQFDTQRASPWADAGYYLVFAIGALYLLLFRKGWLIKWCVVLLINTSVIWSPPAVASDPTGSFADFWFTPDQQGRYYFDKGDFASAAVRFESPLWKGLAHYYDGDYENAEQYCALDDTPKGQFCTAMALVRQGDYFAARVVMQIVVDIAPELPGAAENLLIIEQILNALRRAPAGQSGLGTKDQIKGEKRGNPNGSELIFDESAAEGVNAGGDESLSAEEIMKNAAVNAKWMKRIDNKLDRFLQRKFESQYKLGKATQEYSDEQ